jgi:aromatic-L-amino-acid/L-tryptophan decarboxylase
MNQKQPSKNLQLSRSEMRALSKQVVDLVIEHFENLRSLPVVQKSTIHGATQSTSERKELSRQLRGQIPYSGTDIKSILQELEKDILNQIVHTDHPRFFAFVPSPSNFVSVMADTLVSGFNVFAGTWLVGKGAAEIERETIDWLRQLCGLPESAGGLFVSGGSMANLTALATARHIMLNDQIDKALVYFSDQTHSSIIRALKILGFAQHQLRSIPCDKDYRLSMEDVQNQVAYDREQGNTPFCVIANTGTTNTGAIDPLADLADFCQAENLWLHVDGAFGAAAVLTSMGKKKLAGLERADSITIDPHKWLFQPYEIGCLIVREQQTLKDTFCIMPEYLHDVNQTAEDEINYCNYGAQLTRSFRALKLWMSFKAFGIDTFSEAISWGMTLAEIAEHLLQELPDWEVVSSASIGIVTFRYIPTLGNTSIDAINQQIVNQIVSSGFAMLSTTVLKGRKVIRMCTINPRTTEEDILQTIIQLNDIAKSLTQSVLVS